MDSICTGSSVRRAHPQEQTCNEVSAQRRRLLVKDFNDFQRPSVESPTSPGNPLAEHLKNIRWLGMTISGREMLQGPTSVWNTGGGPTAAATVKWSSEVINEKHLVRADYGRNERVEWLIDPARGWNAERITQLIRSGDTVEFSPMAESIISLERIGGQWFPRAIRQYERGAHFREIDVLEAAMNSPDDPPALTATNIGVESGFSVAPQDFSAGSPRGLRWSSMGLVEAAKWDELERGGKKPGPTLQRELRGELSPAYTPQLRPLESPRGYRGGEVLFPNAQVISG